MKNIIGILILGGLFLSACEEDPVIQADGFTTQPIIYSIIDSNDTVHYIRIGRVFSGLKPSGEAARNKDSIYFDSIDVQVYVKEISTGKMINLPVQVPGLPMARCETPLVSPPTIWSPDRAQTDIYIYPDSPLRVQWSGDVWNEIDITFEIKEHIGSPSSALL